LRRGAGAAWTISILAHLAILTLIGLYAPKLQFVETPERAAVTLVLPEAFSRRPRPTPRPAARQPLAQTPLASPPKSLAPRAPRPSPQPQRTAPQRAAPPTALQGTLSAPSGVEGRPAPPAPSAGAPPSGSVEDALRTSVGCDVEDEALLKLSPQERARCHQAFGAEAAKGEKVFGIDPLKRKRFDAQVAEDERRRDRNGPLPGAVKDCAEVDPGSPGSNLGHGCLTSHIVLKPN
jgi:hypothetical protein